MTAPSRIYDSGYRRYDGPRLGAGHAARALITHTLQRIFGLHRPARTKVLPILSVAIAYIPPTVFVGLAAFLPKQIRSTLPNYGDIYGFISAAVLVFVIFVAPEAICPDRRSGVLSIYLAAPLTRSRYLASKAAAVFTALLFVTLGPPVLLLVGLSLQSAGPDGFGGWVLVFIRIITSGVMVAAFYTSLSMAAASLTDRRAIAAAGMFIAVFASNAITGAFVFGAGAPRWLLSFSISRGPFELTRHIHGLPPFGDLTVGTAPLVVAVVVWSALAAFIAWNRYRTLQVTR